MSINVNELTPKQRRDLGIRKTREQVLKADDIRGYAIAALNQLRDLSRNERKRVISHMTKMNDV